jgi:opacity protein-like surface antigen
MKKSSIAALALFAGAVANTHGEKPVGLSSHWGFDMNVGYSSMTNAPLNSTPSYDAFYADPTAYPPVATAVLAVKDWMYYSPRWNTMKPQDDRNGRGGVVAQGGFSYLRVCDSSRVGMGWYAHFGYNGARSSAVFQPLAGEALANARSWGAQGVDVIYPGILQSKPSRSLAPEAKVTVASGVNFDLGVRMGLGTFQGKFFPYMKAGWALYRLDAKMGRLWVPPADQYYDATQNQDSTERIGQFLEQGAAGNGAGQQYNSHQYTAKDPAEYIQDLWPSQMATVRSGPRWTNAGVVGLGVDFGFRRNMVVGLSYQAAFCGAATFKKWKKAPAGGLKIVSKTDGGENPSDAQSWYNVATSFEKMPSVTIRPIFQTVMMTLKYVWPSGK